jgi:predicted acyltransferase
MSGLAIASFVLACFSFFLGLLGLIPAVAGIVCGRLARQEIHDNPAMVGDGLAAAGVIIGSVSLALGLLTLLWAVGCYIYIHNRF